MRPIGWQTWRWSGSHAHAPTNARLPFTDRAHLAEPVARAAYRPLIGP